jgi:NAD(P)H-hydrate epimerase
VKADLVISFQRPKVNFFFPESAPFINRFRFVDIGLDENFVQSQPGRWKLLEAGDISKILKLRKPFSHKGTYGHALIIAGNTETMGAALLCADACLHSGAGLTTAYIPLEVLTALNSHSPEVMALVRNPGREMEIDFKKYQSIAIGPGLGKDDAQAGLLKTVLENSVAPLVLDADALNILSENQNWMSILPRKTILTPHVKEFDRLFGEHESWWERIETGRKKAVQHQLIIVLKNQYSFVILPSGDVLINPTGNPAMAVGGMGDVLTGMIAAFLAQGYKPEEAALMGCYLHGKAGDVLQQNDGMHCIPPRYLINELPKTISSFIW